MGIVGFVWVVLWACFLGVWVDFGLTRRFFGFCTFGLLVCFGFVCCLFSGFKLGVCFGIVRNFLFVLVVGLCMVFVLGSLCLFGFLICSLLIACFGCLRVNCVLFPGWVGGLHCFWFCCWFCWLVDWLVCWFVCLCVLVFADFGFFGCFGVCSDC